MSDERNEIDEERKLRVFDLKTRWFWFIVFYKRNVGASVLELRLWKGKVLPQTINGHSFRSRWWLFVWDWEGGSILDAEIIEESAAVAVPD